MVAFVGVLFVAMTMLAAPAEATTGRQSAPVAAPVAAPQPASPCTTVVTDEGTTRITTVSCRTESPPASFCQRVRAMLFCITSSSVTETIDKRFSAGGGSCSLCIAAQSFQGSRTTTTAVTTTSHGRGYGSVTGSVTSSGVSGACTGYQFDFFNDVLVPVDEPLSYCFG